MPVTVDTVRTVPSTGSGRCSSKPCSACTSMARSKSPRLRPVRAWAISTAKVGRTFCSIPSLFSVVNSSSRSGSPRPAPTPTAYSSASVEVQDRSCGSLRTPTRLWSRVMTTSRSQADARRQPLAVVAAVAEEQFAGLRPLEEQVRVVLPGEADAAVDLDVLGGHVEVGLRGIRLDQRGHDGHLVGSLRDGGGRIRDGRPE